MSEGPDLGSMLSLQNHGSSGAASGASLGEIYEMRGPLTIEAEALGELIGGNAILKKFSLGFTTAVKAGLLHALTSGPATLPGLPSPSQTPLMSAKSGAIFNVQGR